MGVEVTESDTDNNYKSITIFVTNNIISKSLLFIWHYVKFFTQIASF